MFKLKLIPTRVISQPLPDVVLTIALVGDIVPVVAGLADAAVAAICVGTFLKILGGTWDGRHTFVDILIS